jgi:hypothetical protein
MMENDKETESEVKELDSPSIKGENDPPQQKSADLESNDSREADDKYPTGVKLWTILGSLTVIMFLMMLDMSIVVTVLSPSFPTYRFLIAKLSFRPFLVLPLTFTVYKILDGMEALISCLSKQTLYLFIKLGY